MRMSAAVTMIFRHRALTQPLRSRREPTSPSEKTKGFDMPHSAQNPSRAQWPGWTFFMASICSALASR